VRRQTSDIRRQRSWYGWLTSAPWRRWLTS